MNEVFAYIRVSTLKQGLKGVSLQEQKSAIIDYAKIHKLKIVEWFEEKETAAKQGRLVFANMLEKLRKEYASGVIIHKIDRSARNLRDWAALGDLLDYGIDVHFANENVDLRARGGRLSADIQAVIAADFIRNLREETKKGMYGRLKQGLYPFRAPLGYLDAGSGNPKRPDPKRAHLIVKTFELYSTGEFTLHTIREEMSLRGLRSHSDSKLSINGFSKILKNPFYMGVIKIKKTGETFDGIHEPLISKSTYDSVQDVISGRRLHRKGKHHFLFRRLFTCKKCGYSLIGEKQKGHNYYRCHNCRGTCIREDIIMKTIESTLHPLKLSEFEIQDVSAVAKSLKKDIFSSKNQDKKKIHLQKVRINKKIDRLTDSFLEGVVDKKTYLRKKESLLHEAKTLDEKEMNISSGSKSDLERMISYLELVISLYSSFFKGNDYFKRKMVNLYTSNRFVDQKNVMVELNSPFKELSEGIKLIYGRPPRTLTRSMGKLHCVHIRKRQARLKEIVRKIIEDSDGWD